MEGAGELVLRLEIGRCAGVCVCVCGNVVWPGRAEFVDWRVDLRAVHLRICDIGSWLYFGGVRCYWSSDWVRGEARRCLGWTGNGPLACEVKQ